MGVYADATAAGADGVIHHWTFDDFTPGYFADQIGDWNGTVRNPNAHDVSASIVSTPLGSGLNTAANGLASADDLMQIILPVSGRSPLQLSNYTVRYRFYYTDTAKTGELALPETLNLGAHDYGNWPVGNFLQLTNFYDDLVVWVDDSGSGITAPDLMTPGAWVDVVVKNESNVTYLYLAGVKDTETRPNTAGLNLYVKDGYLGFGSATHAQKYFLNGIIDELTIWNRALSDAEVANLYDGGTAKHLIAPPAPILPTFDRTDYTIKSIKYQTILTGAADSLPDVVLPVSSINARYRSGSESYLSVVVPNGSAYEQAIADRPNADLIVNMIINGQSTQLIDVNLETTRIDEGAGAGVIITLTGHKQTTNSSPKTIAVGDASYYRQGDNSTGLRMVVDPNVKPGDTVVFRGQSLLVAVVSYNISSQYQSMEITT